MSKTAIIAGFINESNVVIEPGAGSIALGSLYAITSDEPMRGSYGDDNDDVFESTRWVIAWGRVVAVNAAGRGVLAAVRDHSCLPTARHFPSPMSSYVKVGDVALCMDGVA